MGGTGARAEHAKRTRGRPRKMNDRDRQLVDEACGLLFELSRDGVLVADEDGRIRDANETLCAMLAHGTRRAERRPSTTTTSLPGP